MKCSICMNPLAVKDSEQCKECGKYMHKSHMKNHVCYKCDMASRFLLEKLESKGYLKTR